MSPAIPHALKWQVVRADGDFDAAQVEARRTTVDSTRINLETFPLAVSLAEAERQCKRQLAATWAERERAAFKLPAGAPRTAPTPWWSISTPARSPRSPTPRFLVAPTPSPSKAPRATGDRAS